MDEILEQLKRNVEEMEQQDKTDLSMIDIMHPYTVLYHYVTMKIQSKIRNMKKAQIKQVTHGKRKGQFRFLLLAENGEVVAQSHPETYTQKHSCIETLQSCFPDYVIEDLTCKS